MIDIDNMTVAIVDDAENMCKLIRGMLKNLHIGKTFYYGYNGRDALGIVRKHMVDLLIMDWNMPVMDGVEALGQIREDEKLRDLPVVMVTGEASSEMVAEAAEWDIDAYILKPLNVKSLGDKIRAVVDKANHPPPMMVHLKRAREFKEAGDISKAMEELKNALKADPTSTKPLREIGRLYFEQGHLAPAEKFFLKASEMNRYDVFSFQCLGEIHLKRDEIEKAIQCFEMAMQVSPRNIARGINFGKALVKKQAFEKAEKVFDRALALSGDSLPLTEEVADFCMAHGSFEYAAQLYQLILKKNPDRTDVMMNIGLILEKAGEYLEAAKYFGDVEKKEPDNLDARFHLAESYLAVNQALRADRVLQDILKIDPENERAREMLKQNT